MLLTRDPSHPYQSTICCCRPCGSSVPPPHRRRRSYETGCQVKSHSTGIIIDVIWDFTWNRESLYAADKVERLAGPSSCFFFPPCSSLCCRGRPPYFLAKTKDVRDAFRKARATSEGVSKTWYFYFQPVVWSRTNATHSHPVTAMFMLL